MDYSLYIVVCADGTYYTGIARDAVRRVMEHNGEKGKGARYTASRRPVRLVYHATFANRSEAQKEEARIKALSRAEKEALIVTACGAPERGRARDAREGNAEACLDPGPRPG